MKCVPLAAVLLVTPIFLSACDKPAIKTAVTDHDVPPGSLSGPVEITSESGDGSGDLVFFIRASTSQSDGSHLLHVEGLHKSEPVAFDVVVSEGQKLSGQVPQGLSLMRARVTYKHSGAASDAFIRTLASVYGITPVPPKMIAEQEFTAISLAGNPSNLESEPVKMKLFFERGDEYAEFYTNVYFLQHRLELFEKDESYRALIVRSLAAD